MAEGYLDEAKPVAHTNLPGRYEVNFYFLTTTGRKLLHIPAHHLDSKDSRLYELYLKGIMVSHQFSKTPEWEKR